jgi:ABC-type Co2+ transport system permease subunit
MTNYDNFDVKGALLTWAFLFALVALLYWIWRTFSGLAGRHNKVKWQFGLLGIIAFMAGSYIGRLVEGILVDYVLSGLLRLPLGLLSCWGMHRFLKTSWTKND